MNRYGTVWRWNYEDARRRVVAAGAKPSPTMGVKAPQEPTLAASATVLHFARREH